MNNVEAIISKVVAMRYANIANFERNASSSNIDQFHEYNDDKLDIERIVGMVDMLCKSNWEAFDIIRFCSFSEHVDPTNTNVSEVYALGQMENIRSKYYGRKRELVVKSG